MDEAQIISGLRACSAEAYEALYDTYAADLYDYCYALLQNAAAAGDALRDTLLGAASTTESIPAGSSLRAWLYALARGMCRAGGDRMIEHPVPEDDPSALLLISVLGALTASDRELLELVGRHGLDDTGLQVVLGLAPHRVEPLVTEARHRFDLAMADELDRTGPVEYPSLAAVADGGDPLPMLFQAIPRIAPPRALRARVLDDLLVAGSTGVVPPGFADRGAFAEQDAPTGEIPVPGPAHGRRKRRGPLLVGAAAAVVVLAAGVVFGVTRLGGSPQDDARAAVAPTPTVRSSVPATPTTTRTARPHVHKRHAPPSGSATPTASGRAGKRHPARTGSRQRTATPPRTSSPPTRSGGGPTTHRPKPPATGRPPSQSPTHSPSPTTTPTPTESTDTSPAA